jgi:DNA-binding CsgD family transcriptional regulator
MVEVPILLVKKRRHQNYFLSEEELFYLRLCATNISINEMCNILEKPKKHVSRLKRDIKNKFDVQSDCQLIMKAFALKTLEFNDYINPRIISSAISTANKIIEDTNVSNPIDAIVSIKLEILSFLRRNQQKFIEDKERALKILPENCVDLLFLKSQGIKKRRICENLQTSYFMLEKNEQIIFDFFQVENYFWAIRRAFDYNIISQSQYCFKPGIVDSGILAEKMLSWIVLDHISTADKTLKVCLWLYDFYTYLEFDRVLNFINRNKIL